MTNKLWPLAFLLFLSGPNQASTAEFEFNTQFRRNPKIWGTYKLSRERITIKRGQKVWKKSPPKRVGDIIISDGHLIFIRENQSDQKTKIVVDKIPYQKRGSSVFEKSALSSIEQEKIVRLFQDDLKDLIPHRDLLLGDIEYEKISCKKTRGRLNCKLKGQLIPQ